MKHAAFALMLAASPAAAFDDMQLASVTALLPPGRGRAKGMLRLGFQRDGELQIGAVLFHRYRCWAPGMTASHRNGE